MRRLRVLLQRLIGIVPSQRREQEFAAEIDSHVAMHMDDNLRAGMATAEARRRAILALGGIEMTKQAYRNQGTTPFLETVLQDVRFGLRQLRKNLGFTATAILMLASGMCASVATFAFVDAALIKPLPYTDPSRLMDVAETAEVFGRTNISYPDYLDWKKMNTVFLSMDVYGDAGYMLPTSKGSELVTGARVSDGFFSHTGRDAIAGPGLLCRRRSAERSTDGNPELQDLAVAVPGEQGHHRTNGHLERCSVRDCGCAAGELPVCPKKPCGVLGDHPCGQGCSLNNMLLGESTEQDLNALNQTIEGCLRLWSALYQFCIIN